MPEHNRSASDQPAPSAGATLARHVLMLVVVAYLLGPLVASLGLFFPSAPLALPFAAVTGLASGRLCAGRQRLPSSPGGRYLVPMSFGWVLFFGFVPFMLANAFGGNALSSARFIPHLYVPALLAAFTVTEQKRADKVRISHLVRGLLAGLLLFPLALMGYGLYQDATGGAGRGHGFEGRESFSRMDSRRFATCVGSGSPRLAAPSTITIGGAKTPPAPGRADVAFRYAPPLARIPTRPTRAPLPSKTAQTQLCSWSG